jgi:rhodanese-related sulfurtransferase
MSHPRISPSESYAKITREGYVQLDVRTEDEMAAGHPEGAYNVPLMLSGPEGMVPNDDFVRVVSACFPRDSKLVVACRSGNRSQKACAMLLEAGYAHVVERGWEAAGLPCATEAMPGRDYAALRKRAGL